MKKNYIIICLLISFISFSQSKESNGAIFKNGFYVETVRTLMNTYLTNNIKKIKKAYQKVSVDNITFRDALNNMDVKNPFGINMNLDKEMENMNDIFKTHKILNIKELGYPDHLDYTEGDDLVLSWWQFTWKNKSSGSVGPVHLMIGHFFNNENKMTNETYYFNPTTLP